MPAAPLNTAASMSRAASLKPTLPPLPDDDVDEEPATGNELKEFNIVLDTRMQVPWCSWTATRTHLWLVARCTRQCESSTPRLGVALPLPDSSRSALEQWLPGVLRAWRHHCCLRSNLTSGETRQTFIMIAVPQGDPRDKICEFAADEGLDLLVVGRR